MLFSNYSDKWFFISDFCCMKTETFPRVSLGQENAWAADAELGGCAEDFWVLRELCKFACSVRL